jgi:probable rRNA maturation factor
MQLSTEADSNDPDNPGKRKRRQDRPAARPMLLQRQRRVKADWEQVRRFLERLSESKALLPYTICVVSDRRIRDYNHRFRNRDEATDVLSFPVGRVQGSPEDDYLGDIVISAETARENAARFGLRVEEEISLLALHGVLHLLGHDHKRDNGEMAQRERRWAAQLGLPETLIGRSLRRKLGSALGSE